MKEMVPSYGESLDDNVALLHEVRRRTLATLRLDAARNAKKSD